MKHAIVTGATGFIGAELCAQLSAHGVSVSALCREKSPSLHRLPPDVHIVLGMQNLPKADVFYHLAWESASGPGRSDPIVQSKNASLALGCLEHAHALGCKRFIALGTVYQRLARQVRARGDFSGSDYYILSKEYACDMARQLAFKLGIECVWCTICHPIGRYIKPDQMMHSVVSDLLKGVSPQLGPCKTLYDILAVEDVAQGLRLLGGAKLGSREYYIGSGKPRPLCAWLEDARRALWARTPLGIGVRPDDGLRFDESWFDTSILESDTGYKPDISYAQAVRNVAGFILQS